MKKFLLFVSASLVLFSANAQRTDELGLFIGGSYYTGDLNPSMIMNSLTRPAVGLVYRHNFNLRLSVAGSALFGSIQGIDARSSSYEQQQRNLSFRSPVYELAGRAEFNFIEYKIGDDKHEFTPFMFLGAAVFNFNPKAAFGNQWVALQPLKTEGQGKPYMRTQFSIPFGAGIKTNLAKRIGLVAEWGLRKTFTDYLDDVSTVYADPGTLYSNGGPLAVAVADRSTSAGSNAGRQRGNPRTKDWYSFAGLTLTFQLAHKPAHCSAY
ncbi:MAG TPA: DUF6089 family protein [Bacteroidia bacterium]|nr:DUF6089 family protein [Bacteroidia bacterium]